MIFDDIKSRILSDYDTESGIRVSKSSEISADDLYREDYINGINLKPERRDNPAKKLPLTKLIGGLFKESPITRQYFAVVCFRTLPIYMGVLFAVLLLAFFNNLLTLTVLGVLWIMSILAAIIAEIIFWVHLPDERSVEARKEYELLIKSAKEAIK